jgi:hypothetical protein
MDPRLHAVALMNYGLCYISFRNPFLGISDAIKNRIGKLPRISRCNQSAIEILAK